jgi:hypothetical protein
MLTIDCPSCEANLTPTERASGHCGKCDHDLPANIMHLGRRERPVLDESRDWTLGAFFGLVVALIVLVALVCWSA